MSVLAKYSFEWAAEMTKLPVLLQEWQANQSAEKRQEVIDALRRVGLLEKDESRAP